MAISATVIAARLSSVGGDLAPAVDRLSAYQWGFLACGLLIAPAAAVSLLVRDRDVAATRGLAPADAATRSAAPLVEQRSASGHG